MSDQKVLGGTHSSNFDVFIQPPPASGIEVDDEGLPVVDPCSIVDFRGAGVVVTAGGGGRAIVTIPGGDVGGLEGAYTSAASSAENIIDLATGHGPVVISNGASVLFSVDTNAITAGEPLVPDSNNTRDFGTSLARWRVGYFSNANANSVTTQSVGRNAQGAGVLSLGTDNNSTSIVVGSTTATTSIVLNTPTVNVQLDAGGTTLGGDSNALNFGNVNGTTGAGYDFYISANTPTSGPGATTLWYGQNAFVGKGGDIEIWGGTGTTVGGSIRINGGGTGSNVTIGDSGTDSVALAASTVTFANYLIPVANGGGHLGTNAKQILDSYIQTLNTTQITSIGAALTVTSSGTLTHTVSTTYSLTSNVATVAANAELNLTCGGGNTRIYGGGQENIRVSGNQVSMYADTVFTGSFGSGRSANFQKYVDWDGIAKPSSNPSANTARMYYKTGDAGFYYLDSAGAEHQFATTSQGIIASGTATLDGTGNVTVSTSAVTTGAKILLTRQGTANSLGTLSYNTIVNGVSFDVDSGDVTDNGTFVWAILG